MPPDGEFTDEDAAEAATAMYRLFVAYVAAGFSENQALKLVAAVAGGAGWGSGMPEAGNG